jgi:hypothetical protein
MIISLTLSEEAEKVKKDEIVRRRDSLNTTYIYFS